MLDPTVSRIYPVLLSVCVEYALSLHQTRAYGPSSSYEGWYDSTNRAFHLVPVCRAYTFRVPVSPEVRQTLSAIGEEII